MEEEEFNNFVTPVKMSIYAEGEEEMMLRTDWKIRSSSPLKPMNTSDSDLDACCSVDSSLSDQFCRICMED
jgi:hypothetical protein